MTLMMQDANQSKDVQSISVLVQYLAQRVSKNKRLHDIECYLEN